MSVASGNQLRSGSERVVAHWRSSFVAGCVILGWAVLVGRLIQLQGAQRELLHTKVSRQSTFIDTVPARPGEILDRNGHVLAMTVTCESLYAVPAEIDDPWDFALPLATALNLDADELFRRVTEDRDRQFVWVRRRVTEDQVRVIRDLNLPPRTWGFRREYLRQYPQGAFAAHVLGMRDIDNAGHGGLEQSLDDLIRGVDGRRVMTRDARGVVVEVEAARSKVPEHGRTVISTLDLLTQIETERQLDELVRRWQPVGACAVVMEPGTGDILAMASRPSFDPNTPSQIPDNAWRNLAVSAVFEPGSTFKPFIVAWAMQHGLLQPDEMIPCFNGAYRMGRRVLHDHHAYSELSVEDVLVKSSNIGMARIAERMGLDGLYEATAAFGFGRRTGIELPGEIDGLVRDRSDWNDYSLGSIPMGHELAVTPLQLITAHAALAAGGQLVRPRLLIDTTDQTTDASIVSIPTVDPTTPVESRLVRPDVAAWVVTGPMKGVVERGTAKSVRVSGLSMFGKTGTAQKADPVNGGYSVSRDVCSFVCGAPAESPRVLVLVMVDEPTGEGSHFGGTVAAPAATAVLQFALKRTAVLRSR
ncbi:MAG: penicillin-binding protein 2 [Planctomycetaceae bacterium]